MRVFICSRDDVVTRLDCDGASTEAQPVLEGVPVRRVAADRDRVIIGTQGAGALLSSDGGRRWERMELPERDVFSVAIGPADGTLYAGTEPSRPFVLRDGAEWTELEGLQDIPSRERWSFPPRRDAHAITWHPLADGRAYEAAGDGAAWSVDGGRGWSALDAGRELGYCWALAVDAVHARRPGRRARLRHGRRAAAPQPRSRRELAGTRRDGADHRYGPRSVTVTRPHAPSRELSAGRGA